MNSESHEEDISEALWQAWQAGISAAGSNAAVKLFRSGQPVRNEELFQGWLESIELMINILAEQGKESIDGLNEFKQLSPDEKHEMLKGTEIGFDSFADTIQKVISVMKGVIVGQ